MVLVPLVMLDEESDVEELPNPSKSSGAPVQRAYLGVCHHVFDQWLDEYRWRFGELDGPVLETAIGGEELTYNFHTRSWKVRQSLGRCSILAAGEVFHRPDCAEDVEEELCARGVVFGSAPHRTGNLVPL